MVTPSPTLAAECGLARLDYHALVGSTMDEAHRLAQAGAEAGTLVLADAQESGRGRGGRSWVSEPGAGLWMTLIERPRDQHALDVLALRIGLALSDALEPFCEGRIRLKWPNDLFVGAGKLAGILIEARWRESLPEWVAIGVGVNRRIPEAFPDATSLREDIPRDDVLRAMLPAMRRAAAQPGRLTPEECARWAERDLAFGRDILEPRAGRAMGIDATGALLIAESRGAMYAARSGSLVFAGEAQ
ncbi:biotin--[acetyl-CoA-carboxylase] ligase [Gemmatimonas groenlandica]|uniref:Biotin--[acetyl-CoA-carboxylase] ligase n=1 Tax=Gemmatimonas groenlandica TaxID=2732249 RepID=A0A6M4IJA0_9BACT|nr:biotin--[acetyl-CoA-carboxylase] ligase [Gemmatimonas groenlandica]QJR35164.1 biotin--[acetyl-CoA-carboxylase] ligase [Gemmatimonas groenlandica]